MGPLGRRIHTPGGRGHAEGLVPRPWGRSRDRGRPQTLTWGVGHVRPFWAIAMMLVFRTQLKMLKYKRYGLSL